MIDLETMRHIVKDYQKKKPFASFLSGIAGRQGIPMWTFYVNRGQLVAGFGIRDKNGSIMEFFPANAAYEYVHTIGFRTFVKIRGETHEFFKESNKDQILEIRPDRISVLEDLKEEKIRIEVTYFTLPDECLAGLVRKVDVENYGSAADIEIADGLAGILPSGVDYGGYKAMSNLLQSWMQSEITGNGAFYMLRASTADSSMVSAKESVNFFTMACKARHSYITDSRLIFNQDTALDTPYGFMDSSYEELTKKPQPGINQVPSAIGIVKLPRFHGKTTFHSVFGFADDRKKAEDFFQRINQEYFAAKEKENENLHKEILTSIETHTADPKINAYFAQNYLDNILRGGQPIIFETAKGRVGYHLYSRKHGDLERDYNFFSLAPEYYSQGNGNFRDVIQNRRNDLLFCPSLGDFNVGMFASLIQATDTIPWKSGD